MVQYPYTFFYSLQDDNSFFFFFNAFDSAEILTGADKGPPDKVSFLMKYVVFGVY